MNMKRMACALVFLTSSALAQAPGGPPAGFFGNAQNTGGTLYLKWCTAAGWPCREVMQNVWGQICYGEFAQNSAENQIELHSKGLHTNPEGEVTWPFTKYAGWSCPGATFSDEAKKFGYSDHGEPLR